MSLDVPQSPSLSVPTDAVDQQNNPTPMEEPPTQSTIPLYIPQIASAAAANSTLGIPMPIIQNIVSTCNVGMDFLRFTLVIQYQSF